MAGIHPQLHPVAVPADQHQRRQPHAPTLDAAQIAEFHHNPALQKQLLRAFDRSWISTVWTEPQTASARLLTGRSENPLVHHPATTTCDYPDTQVPEHLALEQERGCFTAAWSH